MSDLTPDPSERDDIEAELLAVKVPGDERWVTSDSRCRELGNETTRSRIDSTRPDG